MGNLISCRKSKNYIKFFSESHDGDILIWKKPVLLDWSTEVSLVMEDEFLELLNHQTDALTQVKNRQ